MSRSDLAAAIDLATRVHEGQVDKAGAAYIGHPLGLPTRGGGQSRCGYKRHGQTHHEAVVRASKDRVGCDVKSADVEDNTDPERMQRLLAELRERLIAKYADVRGILAEARAARA